MQRLHFPVVIRGLIKGLDVETSFHVFDDRSLEAIYIAIESKGFGFVAKPKFFVVAEQVYSFPLYNRRGSKGKLYRNFESHQDLVARVNVRRRLDGSLSHFSDDLSPEMIKLFPKI